MKQKDAAGRMADSADYDYLRDIAAEHIVDRLADISRPFPRALDLGCHSGHILKALREANMTKIDEMVLCDGSESQLFRDARRTAPATGSGDSRDGAGSKETPPPPPAVPVAGAVPGGVGSDDVVPCIWRFVADEESIGMVLGTHEEPALNDPFDLVTSCLSLHWVNDLPGTLVQIRESLRPDGVFVGAMLGGETLHELRTALLIAEQERDGGVGTHVSPLAQVSDAGNLLTRTGFTMPTVDSDTVEVRYDNAFEMMRHVQGMGEANAVASRRDRTGPGVFLAAAAIYQQMFGDPVDGSVPATFEIIYMIGWRPDDTQRGPERRGSATASLRNLSEMVHRVDPSTDATTPGG